MYQKTGDCLKRFLNADWGANIDDRSLYTIFTFELGGVVTWESRKQRTFSLSSTEGEYITSIKATREAFCLRNFLKYDNQSARNFTGNPVHHLWTKHININKYHYVRRVFGKGDVDVKYVSFLMKYYVSSSKFCQKWDMENM